MLDWKHNGRTRWTKEVSKLFAKDFEAQRQIGKFPRGLGAPTAAEVIAAFLNHTVYLKQAYYRSMLVIDEEEEAVIAATEREKARKSRSSSRKTQVRLLL